MTETKIILGNRKVTLGRTKLRRASMYRTDLTLTHIYGNITGTGQVNACLTEMVRDLQHYCRFTGKDFNKLISKGLV